MFNEIKKILEFEIKNQVNLKNNYTAELRKLKKYKNYYLGARKRKGKTYYYKIQRRTHKETYLGSDKNPEVQLLQKAAFYKKALTIIESNIKVLENFADSYQDSHLSSVVNQLAPCYRGVSNVLSDKVSSKGKQWQEKMEAIKATHPVFHPEELTHLALDGSLYRSKSEMTIANYLLTHGIPFVYELPVDTKHGLVVPDFTIYNEKTGEIIFWEHLGLFYDESYYQTQYHKFIKYSSIGYTPLSNMILTVDDINCSFDSTVIPKLLHAFMPEVA